MQRLWGVVAVAAIGLVGCATAGESTDAPPGADGPPVADGAIDQIDAASIDGAPDGCTPATEACNGLDDDCDLGIDEDFTMLGMPCTSGTGACQASGTIVCDGIGAVCNAVAGTPGTETCNSIDDDCDTLTDEGFGVGTACDGTDGDLCVEGTIACSGGAAVCSDTTATSTETCNGADEDCDTLTDEGFPVGQACAVGVGACLRNGNRICSTDGTTTVCNVSAGSPTAETCGDGVDQDCNGGDPTCPSNDFPAGAIDISSGGVFNVDLVAAHDDDASGGSFCGLTGGRDVFYQFTLGAAEVVYADTFGSTYDTVVRIYSGTCPLRSGAPVCSDDACSVLQTQGAVQLAAGTYCLVLDQYSSAATSGTSVLTFTRGGRPGTALAHGASTVSGSTVGAPNLSTGSCQTFNPVAGDQAYFFAVCPATTETFSADTCNATTNYDTVLYVQPGNGTGTIGATACNDDDFTCSSPSTLRSRISGASFSGTGLYWFIVDGYSSNTGSYQVTYSLSP